MKLFSEEYGNAALYMIVAIMCLNILISIPKNDKVKELASNYDAALVQGDNSTLASKEKPILEITEEVVLNVGSAYDYTDYIITATSPDGKEDLKNKVYVYYTHERDMFMDDIDTMVTGLREVKYIIMYDDVMTIKKQIVLVKDYGVIE